MGNGIDRPGSRPRRLQIGGARIGGFLSLTGSEGNCLLGELIDNFGVVSGGREQMAYDKGT